MHALLSSLLTAITATAALCAQAAEPAPATSRDRLLVCNKAEHTLSIFAPNTRVELATLPTGRGPHEVAIAPAGDVAVVTDYGDQQDGSTLTVVDIGAQRVLRTIALVANEVDAEGARRDKTFLRPHGVQFVGKEKVVVTSERARRLLLVDVAAGKVERTWTTPQVSMHMVTVSSDLQRAAASSIREGNVVFFGLAADGVASTPPINCGEGSEGLAWHPGSDLVWVGNRAADTISIVDAKAAKVVKTLTTGDFPFRVAFTTDGKRALVTCAESGELMVFDAKSHELVHEVSIHADGSEQSAMPMGVVANGDGTRAYVTCGRGEFVAAIDLTTGALVDRLPARKGCDGIAWTRLPANAANATGAAADPALKR
jgi:YVTN family beta-propeller protein